jgi:acylphosphatase
MMIIVRKHITFHGWAQSVGFRYRARHAAELYGCTGRVRNEWDGSVTMEIQGTEEAIDKVILAEQGRADRNQSAVKADAQRQRLFRSHL